MSRVVLAVAIPITNYQFPITNSQLSIINSQFPQVQISAKTIVADRPRLAGDRYCK
ncbi:MAG: hypothetical protein HC894_01575 [Microcoleus sp. SM1_3_4]|nr:hypothetical protein [Microcoleus sp. SM1_3_4]